MDPPDVRRGSIRSSIRSSLGASAVALVLAACGTREPVAPKGAAPTPAVAPPPPNVKVIAQADPSPPEHWYFEWLSDDGKRALLRRLDASARGTIHARIVDVDSGAIVDEARLQELGRLPTAAISKNDEETLALDALLEAPALGDDLVKGASIAGAFPFGSCGRLSAAPKGSAIAFNAGDWLYVTDKSGHTHKRVASEAAYDPRFTPDGKHLLFRRATGTVDKVFAKYELFVVPSDLSAAPRALVGTAGARDRFVVSEGDKSAIAISSQEPSIKTCALSVGLKPPFAVRKLACLEGGETLVDSVISNKGRWAALMTMKKSAANEKDKSGKTGSTPPAALRSWRIRVLSLTNGKIVFDEPAEAGLQIRAISDAGLLVRSGHDNVVVDDIPAKKKRMLSNALDLGHRGFFRSATELVYVQGAEVAVIDLAKD